MGCSFYSGENVGKKYDGTSYPFCHFVYFNVQEVQILIEVLVFEQAFTDHLRTENHDIASAMTS